MPPLDGDMLDYCSLLVYERFAEIIDHINRELLTHPALVGKVCDHVEETEACLKEVQKNAWLQNKIPKVNEE